MKAPVELELGRLPLEALVATLRERGVRLNAYGEALLASGRVQVAVEPCSVKVVVRTAEELGWPAGAQVGEVLRALPGGLASCPLEVALQLRLAWRDQPVWPRITVASERADPDETQPRGFYLVDREDGCWLRAYVASDDWRMEPSERLALLEG